MNATLIRTSTSDQGTHGTLVLDGFVRPTLELPWRNNERNVSCIPCGVYRCTQVHSQKFGMVYHISNVPNRSWILIHLGNWAGDTSEGWKSDVEGCILIGTERGEMEGQNAVIHSRYALEEFMFFMEHTDYETFWLEVTQQIWR